MVIIQETTGKVLKRAGCQGYGAPVLQFDEASSYGYLQYSRVIRERFHGGLLTQLKLEIVPALQFRVELSLPNNTSHYVSSHTA